MFSPRFTISQKILRQIGQIEGAREVILSAPLVPAWEAKFREEAIIRTVHHGTHLEGNELNYSEAAKVVAATPESGATPAQVVSSTGIVGRERDIQEVINYRAVLRFIEEYQEFQRDLLKETGEKGDHRDKGEKREEIKHKEMLGIPEQVVKHLHKLTVEKIFPPEKCGSYRESQVVVKNSATGEVTFRPPPAIEVPYLMADFVAWINSTDPSEFHPVIKAGICQYELVRIHPFLDGNGRVARALAILVLFLENYDIRKFFSLEEYYDRDTEHYYQALQAVEKLEGDLTGWLEYFTLGLAIELSRVKDRVHKLSVDMHLKEKMGGVQVFLSERQIKIVEYLQQAGFLQNRAFAELFPMISEDTILRDLKALSDKGLVRKEGKTKAAKYVLVK